MAEAPAGSRPGRRASLTAAAAGGSLQVAGLLVFVMLSGRLPAEELGAYRQALILQSVPSMLLSMGAPAALLYFLGRAESREERSAAYRAALAWMVLTTPLLGFAAWALALLGSSLLGNPALGRAAIFAGVAGAFTGHALYTGPVLLSGGRPRLYLLFAMLQTALLVGLTAALVRQSPRVEAALAAAAVAGVSGWLLTALVFARELRGGGGTMPIHRALRYGAPISAGSCLYLVGYQMDHFVAARHFSAEQYALYAAGAWQLPIGPVVQQAQADVLLPTLSAHHAAARREEFWREWRRLVGPWGVLGAALFWLIFPMAGTIVHLALGPHFEASAEIFRIYALMLPLRMIAYSLPLRAAGATRWDLGASLAFGVVNLAVGAALAPALGLMGPAVGVVCGYAAWIAINLAGTARMLSAPPAVVLPVRMVAASLVLGAAAALPAWVLAEGWVPDGWARLAAYAGLYGALLGGAFRRLRTGGKLPPPAAQG